LIKRATAFLSENGNIRFNALARSEIELKTGRRFLASTPNEIAIGREHDRTIFFFRGRGRKNQGGIVQADFFGSEMIPIGVRVKSEKLKQKEKQSAEGENEMPLFLIADRRVFLDFLDPYVRLNQEKNQRNAKGEKKGVAERIAAKGEGDNHIEKESAKEIDSEIPSLRNPPPLTEERALLMMANPGANADKNPINQERNQDGITEQNHEVILAPLLPKSKSSSPSLASPHGRESPFFLPKRFRKKGKETDTFCFFSSL
jgi:hypothetical protein